MRLWEGDIVVLVTDGTTATGSEWIPSELKSLAEKSPEEIAENVLSSEFIGSETVIVLLHDSATRTTTPTALQILISEFRKMGYEFGKL